MAFARAERSSYYDLMVAAHESPSAARRASYLAHAIDEARHAHIFTLRAEELCPEVARDPRQRFADFEQLYQRLGETRFVAFVHLGELRGRARLSAFRDEHGRRGDHKTRALLDAILRDEARHCDYTSALLAELSPERTRTELLRARSWELGRIWLRQGAVISHALFALSMRFFYFVLFPLALFLRAGRAKEPRSWR